MKISVALHLTLCLFTLLIQSCNGQTGKLKDNKTSSRDTFIRDIPLYRSGKETQAYAIMRQLERKLGLHDITSGFDSIQLRIHFSYSGKDTAHLVLLNYQNNKWDAKLYTYLFGNNDSINEFTPVSFVSRYPSSGWIAFISKIYAFEILTLPDMDKINNAFEIYEGDVITVEYATRTKYRLYQYVTPYRFQKLWKEAKQMDEITKVLESELNFKRLRVPKGQIYDRELSNTQY